MSFNEITGDKIKTRPSTENFDKGWDAIWGNKKTQEAQAPAPTEQAENTEVKLIYKFNI